MGGVILRTEKNMLATDGGCDVRVCFPCMGDKVEFSLMGEGKQESRPRLPVQDMLPKKG